MEDLNKTIDQLNLIDIDVALHPTTATHTFFSPANGMFKIDHLLDHKISLHKFQNAKALNTPRMFLNWNGITRELQNKILRKFPNIWKLKNTF